MSEGGGAEGFQWGHKEDLEYIISDLLIFDRTLEQTGIPPQI
jgi:hypothetical protein